MIGEDEWTHGADIYGEGFHEVDFSKRLPGYAAYLMTRRGKSRVTNSFPI